MKFKNQDLHDLFIETLFCIDLHIEKNEIKLQIFGPLALNVISAGLLIHGRGL